MSAAPAMVSIGDTGVLNREISLPLSEVWIDRDLGWLDFNDRVLAQALDARTPLLERVKFLAIFTANLDEFFMKRVSVQRSGSTPGHAKLLTQVREGLVASLQRQAECFRNAIIPGLATHGIHLRDWDELTPGQRAEAARYFDDQGLGRSHSPGVRPRSRLSVPFEPIHFAGFCSGRPGRRDNFRCASEGAGRAPAVGPAGNGCPGGAKG